MIVERLKALRTGESLVYYRGQLPGDIGRWTVPLYAAVLAQVCATVAELEWAGRIEVCARDLEIPLKNPDPKGPAFVRVHEYGAVGK